MARKPISAPTVGELAARLGLDPATLVATVSGKATPVLLLPPTGGLPALLQSCLGKSVQSLPGDFEVLKGASLHADRDGFLERGEAGPSFLDHVENPAFASYAGWFAQSG